MEGSRSAKFAGPLGVNLVMNISEYDNLSTKREELACQHTPTPFSTALAAGFALSLGLEPG